MKYVTPIDKSFFLQKVYNYDLNPQGWIFLGRIPALIMFHQEDNKFCKEILPALEIIGKKNKGKIDIYTVDIVKEKELAALFTIDNIPVFYLCPMNGEPTVVRGDINISLLREKIENMI